MACSPPFVLGLWLIVLAIYSLGSLAPAAGVNPGISIRVTQKAFNYVSAHKVYPLVVSQLKNAKIPDSSFVVSDLRVSVYHVLINSFKVNPILITPVTATESLRVVLNITAFVYARWHARLRSWPHLGKKGTLNVQAYGLCVDVQLKINPGHDGVWQISMAKLNVGFENFQLSLHGGGILTPVIDVFKSKIKSAARTNIIKAIRSEVTSGIAKLTPLLKKYLPFLHLSDVYKKEKDFALDLRLVSSGVWKDNCSATLPLTGVFYYKKKPFNPYPATPFPPSTDCLGHMLTVYLSGGTVSSLAAAIVASGLAHGNFTTTRYADNKLVGTFIPGMKALGHGKLILNLRLNNASVRLLRSAVHVDFLMKASLDLLYANGSLFHGAIELTLPFTVEVREWLKPNYHPEGGPVMTLICLNITKMSLGKMSVISSKVGPVYVEAMRQYAQEQMDIYQKNINALLKLGAMFIPRVLDMKLVEISNIAFKLDKDLMTLAVDLIAKNNKTSMAEWTEALDPDRIVTAVIRPIVDISYRGIDHVFQGVMPPPSSPGSHDGNNLLRVQIHNKNNLHRLPSSNAL